MAGGWVSQNGVTAADGVGDRAYLAIAGRGTL